MVFESPVKCPVQTLWDFHGDVRALKLLSPPGAKVTIVGSDTAVTEGALHQLKITQLGLSLRWDARIHDVRAPFGFHDTAERSPFVRWTHHHEFIVADGGSLLRDTVEFELPIWAQLLTPIVKLQVSAMFRHRHRVTLCECSLGSG